MSDYIGLDVTRRPKSETRAIILGRAEEMTGQTLPRLAIVLEDLGHTTGAGYQCWQNQQAFWDELVLLLQSQPWVVNGEVDQRALRLAVRHCDLGLLTSRFAELDDLAAASEFTTGPDLLWEALLWADKPRPRV